MKFFFIFFFVLSFLEGKVFLGVENLVANHQALLKGKTIGLITNFTAIDSKGNTTIELLKQQAGPLDFTLAALFAPEHGLMGLQHAGDDVVDEEDANHLPIYGLHGLTRRPTEAMLKNIDLLIFDMQDIGSRSYTYITTLFYAMEEAAKLHIPFIVLDRPNPLGGECIDGPMLEDSLRSFVGYLNVPYCHGLTIGELALFFNKEYNIGCELTVIPMKEWLRKMSFQDTGLIWIPTSPQIPEADTPFFYPATGLLGELQIVNIGVGYTLPFKVVGAPWIDAEQFAARLNSQQFQGVRFQPFHYTPFFGRFAGEACHGVLICITDRHSYLPVTTQYLILGTLKVLYPTFFQKSLEAAKQREEMFNKVNGTSEVLRILKEETFVVWKLRSLHQKEREQYLKKRKAYLLYN